MSTPIRLTPVTDPSANGADDPITADVTLRGGNGQTYKIMVTCGGVADLGRAAEEAAEHLGYADLAYEDWEARS